MSEKEVIPYYSPGGHVPEGSFPQAYVRIPEHIEFDPFHETRLELKYSSDELVLTVHLLPMWKAVVVCSFFLLFFCTMGVLVIIMELDYHGLLIYLCIPALLLLGLAVPYAWSTFRTSGSIRLTTQELQIIIISPFKSQRHVFPVSSIRDIRLGSMGDKNPNPLLRSNRGAIAVSIEFGPKNTQKVFFGERPSYETDRIVQLLRQVIVLPPLSQLPQKGFR